MQTILSILGKFRFIAAAVMVLVLVVSQIGMSHAMAVTPDRGLSHGVNHCVQLQTASYPTNHFDELHSIDKVTAAANHLSKMPNGGTMDFDHDEQGNHCAALCVSAILPANFVLSAGLVKDVKFGQTHTVGLSNAQAGLKRPPRT